ncbi:MAG: PQQ-dependent sugar dehydrogenase [Verrucomicrobia bacterium]|nr:PQQ-dependent sugar dehydrogenase [Verrucomicrobiota bacterium]
MATAALLGRESHAVQPVPNRTLQVPLDPPAEGYLVTNAFPGLTFSEPVAVATPPGETNRLFVVERAGRILVLTNLAQPNLSVFLDLTESTYSDYREAGLLGLAFHPGFATNGFLFTYRTRLIAAETTTPAMHDCLSRFQVALDDPNRAAPESELPLIQHYDMSGEHNAGDVHFGPDGYLYVGFGDAGGAIAQSGFPKQAIDRDFYGCIIRIDVDKRPGSLPPNARPSDTSNYSVPADNPFIGTTHYQGQPVDPARVRTEIWALGFRNPWRMSFDPVTGALYCGDVGAGVTEEIDIIQRGGNYGWPFLEGPYPFFRDQPPEFAPSAPVHFYLHGVGVSTGRDVIGGVVYRGSKIPALHGGYVFGDHTNGNLWTLGADGATTGTSRWLALYAGVAAFGVDPRDGELLLVNVDKGEIGKLLFLTAGPVPSLPPTLADAGVFADLAALTPHEGILPYEINVPFWSDHALKRRWFGIRDTDRPIQFQADANWQFPGGSFWIKHFELELQRGNPNSARRLETRVLVKSWTGLHGVTYRWDASQKNALLVPPEGMNETLFIDDGAAIQPQTWRYPARVECLDCHTAAGGYALGFNTGQLNCAASPQPGAENQLVLFGRAGLFDRPIPDPNTLPAMAHATNTAYSLTHRVRSYLAVNCSQCHQLGLTYYAFWDGRLALPLSAAGIIDGKVYNNFGGPSLRIIKPGSLADSILWIRLARPGVNHMPPLATTVLDQTAIDLVGAWITNELASYQTFKDWTTAQFGNPDLPAAEPEADPDNDGASNELEYLTGSDPLLGSSKWQIAVRRRNDGVQIVFPRVGYRGFEVEWTADLTPPIQWSVLAVPSNRPFLMSPDGLGIVEDLLADRTARFYRVRVFEP